MLDVAAQLVLAATSGAGDGTAVTIPGGDLSSIVGLLNYGVLGILAVGFIRGWVVSPKERDRLAEDNLQLKREGAEKDAEIARLNQVMQDNLQAMVATTDRQIELLTRWQGSTRGDQ